MDSATMCAMVLLVQRLKRRRKLREKLKKRKRSSVEQITNSPLVVRGPFLLDDKEFYQKFRLSKELVHQLLVDLTPHLRFTRQYIRFSSEAKILLTLELFACGSMSEALRNEGITVSEEKKRCFATSIAEFITATTEAIVEHLAPKWIQFPSDDQLESNRKKFLAKFGLAGVIGAIDGMHVTVRRPPDNPALYEIAPNMHSLNVQLICDADEKIVSVEPLNPGSYDESRVWLSSKIRRNILQEYESKNFGYWIVGDDAYPLEPFLMTPFSDTGDCQLTGRQALYNSLLKNVHGIVQKVRRQLRSRFKILAYQTLCYNLNLVSKMVIACCILHNMCLSSGQSDMFDFALEDLSNVDKDFESSEAEGSVPTSSLTKKGLIVRDTIVQTLRDIPNQQVEALNVFDVL
ncbi:hypothetical protein O3M35_003079 [Rhynocoris fuscipes]|uniref:DDE Tnp4 domain-containing protein n=1 Tax=Rhynocoris fuscipes TaxID=488301 RepID=A0AAW1CJ67_9HEMI